MTDAIDWHPEQELPIPLEGGPRAYPPQTGFGDRLPPYLGMPLDPAAHAKGPAYAGVNDWFEFKEQDGRKVYVYVCSMTDREFMQRCKAAPGPDDRGQGWEQAEPGKGE